MTGGQPTLKGRQGSSDDGHAGAPLRGRRALTALRSREIEPPCCRGSLSVTDRDVVAVKAAPAARRFAVDEP